MTSLAFSPDGNNLVSGGDDGALIVWNVSQQHLLAKSFRNSPEGPGFKAFNSDGKILARTIDGAIQLWDTTTLEPLGAPLHDDRYYAVSVAFSPNGKTLAAGCAQETVALWNVNARQMIGAAMQAKTRRGRAFSCVTFSPDGKWLATGSDDRAICLWDTTSQKQAGEALGESDSELHQVTSLVFSPDGSSLVAGGETVPTFWDLLSRKSVKDAFEGLDRSAMWVALDPETQVLAASAARGILLWSFQSRKLIGELLVSRSPGQMLWDEDKTTGLAFSPDGRQLASMSENDGLILWDIPARQQLGRPLVRGNGNHWLQSINLAFSPDGKSLAAPDDSAEVLWDVDLNSWIAKAQLIANRNLTLTEWERFFEGEPYRKTCPRLPGPSD